KVQRPPKQEVVYEKILSQERLSGKEKDTPMFRLLHAFWSQIKADKLQACKIFKMLDKVVVTIVESGSVSHRDLYYELNKNNYDINQLLLIKDYMQEICCINYWDDFKAVFNGNIDDINNFFKNFFVTKFSFKEFSPKRLYEIYVNYVVTMSRYNSAEEIFKKLINSAKLYYDILNVNFKNEVIKNELIKIKLNNGEDTYAYLLNISQDFYDNAITEATFIEILQTVNEYLEKRKNSPTDVPFNDLINYLNVFITCK
ncbi:MAG: hypothetical protein MJ231_05065, partial [bacterium]|nr:hypothetical protein [bacterium]